jgi:hypothetical protein
MALSWKLPMVIEPPAPRTIRVRRSNCGNESRAGDAAFDKLATAQRPRAVADSVRSLSLIFYSLLLD